MMKRIMSVLVLGTILFSCFALFSCDLEKLWGGTTTTTSVTTTTTVKGDPVDPSTLTFEHGDNFTEDDIEFVRSLHGTTYNSSEDKRTISFNKIVQDTNDGMGYLYYATIDIDNPYYICAYIDLDVEENRLIYALQKVDITKFTWYKFEKDDVISETVKNLENAWNYVLYDCTILRDVKNNPEYNHECKYYTKFMYNQSPYVPFENSLLFYSMDIMNFKNNNFVIKNSTPTTIYAMYEDQYGKPYLSLASRMVNPNGIIESYEDYNKKILENYYDVLYPYFERVEEFDYEYVNAEGENRKALAIGISLDIMSEILFGDK